LLGSELIFTDDKGHYSASSTLLVNSHYPRTDPASAGQKKRGVIHIATTSKRITFKEVQLRPKDKPSQSPTAADAEATTTFNEGDEDKEDEDEGLEYYDGEPGTSTGLDINTNMDVDDTLEYVDLDATMTDAPAQICPSRLPTALTHTLASAPLPTPASTSPLPDTPSRVQPALPSPSVPAPSFTSFTSFISETSSVPIPPLSKEKGKDKFSDDQLVENAEDELIDPSLRIDRLTGISPPLTRAPRGSKKASSVPATSATTEVAGSSKGKRKETGKGKQKAKVTHVEDQTGRETIQ
jgi:hypothetical protein